MDEGGFFLTAVAPLRASTHTSSLRTSRSTPVLSTLNTCNVYLAPLGRTQVCSDYPTAPRARFPTERRCTETLPLPVNRSTLIGDVNTLPGPYSSIESPGPGRYASVPGLGRRQQLSQLRGCAKYSFAPPAELCVPPRRRAGPLFLPKLTKKEFEARMSRWDEQLAGSFEQLAKHHVAMEQSMQEASAKLDALVCTLTSSPAERPTPHVVETSSDHDATSCSLTDLEGGSDQAKNAPLVALMGGQGVSSPALDTVAVA